MPKLCSKCIDVYNTTEVVCSICHAHTIMSAHFKTHVRNRYTDYSKVCWHDIITEATATGNAKLWCEHHNIRYRTYKLRKKEYMLLPVADRSKYKYRRATTRASRTLTDSADKLAIVKAKQLQRSGSLTPRKTNLNALFANAANERLNVHRTESDMSTGVVSEPITPVTADQFGRGQQNRFIKMNQIERKKIKRRSPNKMWYVQHPHLLATFQSELVVILSQYDHDCILNVDATDSCTAEGTTQQYAWMFPGIDANYDNGVNTNTRFHAINTVCADGSTLDPLLVVCKAKQREIAMIHDGSWDDIYTVHYGAHKGLVHINKNGSITAALMYKWCKHVLVPYARLKNKPILLLMDSAKIHTSKKMRAHLATYTDVTIVVKFIPENTTAWLQVNDVCIFLRMKARLSMWCTDQALARLELPPHPGRAYQNTLTTRATMLECIHILKTMKPHMIRQCFTWIAHASPEDIIHKRFKYVTP